MTKNLFSLAFAALIILGFAACSKNNDSTATIPLQVRITDAPTAPLTVKC